MSLILAKQRLVVITTHRLSAATVDRIQRDLGSVSRELTDRLTNAEGVSQVEISISPIASSLDSERPLAFPEIKFCHHHPPPGHTG